MTVASMPIEFGPRPLNALVGALYAAKKIAAADDDGDFNPGIGGRGEIAGDARQSGRVEAVLAIAHQRLARQLDDHALPTARRTGARRHAVLPSLPRFARLCLFFIQKDAPAPQAGARRVSCHINDKPPILWRRGVSP